MSAAGDSSRPSSSSYACSRAMTLACNRAFPMHAVVTNASRSDRGFSIAAAKMVSSRELGILGFLFSTLRTVGNTAIAEQYVRWNSAFSSALCVSSTVPTFNVVSEVLRYLNRRHPRLCVNGAGIVSLILQILSFRAATRPWRRPMSDWRWRWRFPSLSRHPESITPQRTAVLLVPPCRDRLLRTG